MFSELQRIADDVNRLAVGASVDEWGVPLLNRVVILEILPDREEILFYDDDNAGMVENLQYNPKVSLSITNVKTFEGRQVKGIAEVEGSASPMTETGRRLLERAIAQGVKRFIRLKIAEIFGVIQTDKSLRNPDWRGKIFPSYESLNIQYPVFSPQNLQPAKIQSFKETFDPFFQAQFEKRFPGFVGTVELRGAPNISPRFIIGAEENFVLWGDRFKNKTFFNFSRPSPIAMYLPDWSTNDGIEFKGWAKFHFFGKTVVQVNEAWHKIGFKDPMQAIHFFPEEIYRVNQRQRKAILKGRGRSAWLPAPAVQKRFNLHVTLDRSVEIEQTSPKVASAPAFAPLALMLSDEPIAQDLIALLKSDLDVQLVPIERYDRSLLANACCLMTVFGNRATEVDLHYLRALFDAAAFYSDANLERKSVKFIVFIVAFEQSISLRAAINALESFAKTLNQSSSTSVEIAVMFLPQQTNSQRFESELRSRVQSVLNADVFVELNHFKIA
ncbi:MAG: pyridoxamine 5'-phosphate oxidase family protein [Chloroherpetonaceae bacterium]|nr:pyridoxamine 5'-phosphate oxidase family protein [Chloroherpetonaceae bacterium]MDW8438377.1 pyridoxamine 5'-phosphate oxidase family protein [Chloroherpetonaceae bacterium]